MHLWFSVFLLFGLWYEYLVILWMVCMCVVCVCVFEM